MENYIDLVFLISALRHISQESLFLKEEKVEEDIRFDIYDLLDFANKLIPFSELELLDGIKDINI